MFPLDFVRNSLKCFAVVIMKAEGHCPVMPEKAREALNFLSGVAGWKCHPAGNNFFTTICDGFRSALCMLRGDWLFRHA
ncbi:hypothetical protein [Desulfonatronospira sp.]|uniref:hypothetical protein n=1 Tax=Desulfonatronospira sp. TaxID=1962951 RepID=UPI0025BCB26F|nr:hypothetical protein [Desulfonatronospira sp.]